MTRRGWGHTSVAVLLGMATGVALRDGAPWWATWLLVMAGLINLVLMLEEHRS